MLKKSLAVFVLLAIIGGPVVVAHLGTHSDATISCASTGGAEFNSGCWGTDVSRPMHNHQITEDVANVERNVISCRDRGTYAIGDMEVMGNTTVTGNPNTGETTVTQSPSTVSVSNMGCG